MPKLQIKVLVVGGCRVGKSSLIAHWVPNVIRNYNNYVPTQNVMHVEKTVTHNRVQFGFSMFDFPGQICMRDLEGLYYRDAQVALVVVDANEDASIVAARKWVRSINAKAPQGIIKILVINKSDAPNTQEDMEKYEEIQKEFEAEKLIYCSVATGRNIDFIFATICNQLTSNVSNTPSFYPLEVDSQYSINTPHTPLLFIRRDKEQEYTKALSELATAVKKSQSSQIRNIVAPWLQQMRRIKRNDGVLLELGKAALIEVKKKVENPTIENYSHWGVLQQLISKSPTTSSSRWRQGCGIALMAFGVLTAITSVVAIATIKGAPAGIIGLGVSQKLIALGAAWYGLTTLSVSAAIVAPLCVFGGNKLRKQGLSQSLVPNCQNISNGLARLGT